MIKKRILPLFMVLVMLLSISPVYSMAEETEIESESEQQSGNTARSGSYSTIIMQGNTVYATDCVAFENALEASQNGYTIFTRCGWVEDDPYPLYVRATASDLQASANSHVAYYSGHGGTYWGSERYPVLNAAYVAGEGSSSPIHVADTLGVSGSNWETTCTFNSSDSLRVLILAACKQLDSSVVKYYARLMSASGIRVIAGYHGDAPVNGDDVIASNFVNYCEEEDSILDAWDKANDYTGGNWDWAALVYHSNGNRDYRLPGFPGTICSAPVSGATVYRYIQGLGSSLSLTSLPESDTIAALVGTLPLSIIATDAQNNTSLQDYSRQPVWTDSSVTGDESAVVKMLNAALNEDISDNPSIQYQVSRDEIDPDSGVVPGTEVIVERTYRFYDTYNGVKIADSFVSASVDSQGINKIVVHRKTVASNNTNIVTMSTNTNSNPVSIENALKLLVADHPCIAHSELHGTSLAYVPDGSGNHVLCYEFIFTGGAHYVSVATGEIIHF